MKSFFQTDAWGNFKAAAGWRAERVDGLLKLSWSLPGGKVLDYYPELSWDNETLVKVAALTKKPATKNTIFSRFEFLEIYADGKEGQLQSLGLIKSFEEVQPDYRQWVPIGKSEAEILAAMKPKGRYNIGVAERADLEVIHGGTNLTKDFYYLYQATSKRTKFRGRGLAYFEKLMALLTEQKIGEILLIKKFDGTLAAGIFLYFDGVASYLYGGSTGDRSLMAPYLLHWEAIKTARARDCQIYDLLAVAPPEDPNHPYAGLSRFKAQFGGQTVRLLGSWDLVQNRFWYTIYRFIEQLRRRKSVQ